jgi:hypothetical protein
LGLWLGLLDFALVGRFSLGRGELCIRNLDDLRVILSLISGSCSLIGSFFGRRGSLSESTWVFGRIFGIFGSRGVNALLLLMLDVEDLLISFELQVMDIGSRRDRL